MTRSWTVVAVVAAVIVCHPLATRAALAQEASVIGVVTDETRSVLPGAASALTRRPPSSRRA